MKIDTAKLATLKANLKAAVDGYISAKGALMKAVHECLEAGATPDEVKKWAMEAGATRQGVNKALKKILGKGQRATRSDKGVPKLLEHVDDMFSPAAKKSAASSAGASDKTPETRVTDYVLGLDIVKNDKAKAIAMLEKVIAALKAAK